MDFIKGQKVQALDELGRWEEARVVDISGDCVHVSFVGWSRDFDLEVKMDDVWELVDPFHMPGECTSYIVLYFKQHVA